MAHSTAQLGERDESAREDSRLVRRSPDVVMSARSKKSSAVNILEEDLLDLQLLWSSIQGRGCKSYDMPYRFQNSKHGERNARNKLMLTLCLAQAENESRCQKFNRIVQKYHSHTKFKLCFT